MMMASRSNHSNFLKDLHDRQALMDRQHALLSYMEKVAKEAQALREENINLKMMNSQLADQLVGLQKANSHLAYQLTAVHKATSYYAAGHSGLGLGLGTGHDVDSMLNAMERMRLGGKSEEGSQHGFDWENDLEDAVLAGSVNVDHAEGKENIAANPDRVSLPKSISDRSPGYLKTQRGESGLKANKQKVLVSGGQKEEEALELDVYYQGMMKTELCKHWQENGGKCPFGEQCHFAHGEEELRRHPRHKTKVCRYGLTCHFGDQCHFRHT